MDPQVVSENADPLLEVAREQAGIDYLYPFQRLVIANSLDAVSEMEPELRRQIVVLPTGSGKTLCFMLPASILSGVSVVVYPLLALMKDQARRAQEANLSYAVLKGGLSSNERAKILADVASGTIRLLITNPEMLTVDAVRDALSEAPIDHLVVDEAHCVSEWGESFRPSYLELGRAIARIGPSVTTAFTATASPRVLSAIRGHLFGNEPTRMVLANPDRPNISYSVIHCYSKLHVLGGLLSNQKLERPALVFCRSRARTEDIARTLAGRVGHEQVAAYHAGLDQQVRARLESWFFASTSGILVSTCAYGMGVDKSNVRTVIHYEPAASVEAFLQESGRAGRDRDPAESILLVDPEDLHLRGTNPRLDQLLEYALSTGCRREFLMRCMGSDSESCFGCDRCTPETRPAAIDQARKAELARAGAVVAVVSRRPRALDVDDLIHSHPNEAEYRQLLSSLLRSGALSICRRWPWKGNLKSWR